MFCNTLCDSSSSSFQPGESSSMAVITQLQTIYTQLQTSRRFVSSSYCDPVRSWPIYQTQPEQWDGDWRGHLQFMQYALRNSLLFSDFSNFSPLLYMESEISIAVFDPNFWMLYTSSYISFANFLLDFENKSFQTHGRCGEAVK